MKKTATGGSRRYRDTSGFFIMSRMGYSLLLCEVAAQHEFLPGVCGVIVGVKSRSVKNYPGSAAGRACFFLCFSV